MSDTPAGFMSDYTGDIRICPNPNCRLVYRPDARQYYQPEKICPKCLTQLVKDEEEVDGKISIGTGGTV